MRTAGLALMCAIASALSGCGAQNPFANAMNGEPVIADSSWFLPESPPNLAESKHYLPPACAVSEPASGGDPYYKWQPDQIRTCASAMRQLIDVRFARYEDSLLTVNSTWNTVTDIAVVGMGAAGGLVGSTTAQILSAASGAVTGIQGKVNSDVMYSHSIQIILQQMKIDRAAQGTILDTQLDKTHGAFTDPDYSGYRSMYAAAIDLYKYARAGSWTEAMISLEANTGGAASTCTQQERALAIGNTKTPTNPQCPKPDGSGTTANSGK